MKPLLKLLALIFSLLVVFAIRAHNILALPVFVDESLHILRAQVVFDFSDAVASFLPGKLLTYYYFGLFNPQNHNGLWITREAIAILAPLSAALCYAIVHSLTRSFRAGILVIWLYALTPFMLFFERMAFADPFAGVFVLALVWCSIQFARHPKPAWAGMCGLMIGLALLAKLTALPLIVVPPLAVWMFSYEKTSVNRARAYNSAPVQSKKLSNRMRYTSPLSSGDFDTVSLEVHSGASLQSDNVEVYPVRARHASPLHHLSIKYLSMKWLLVICYGVMVLLLLLPGLYVIYQEAAQLEEKREVVATSLLLGEDRSRIEQIRFNLRTYDEAVRHLTEPLYMILISVLVWLG